MKKLQSLPIIGKSYNHYDDGKIKSSRLYKVIIKDVKPFDKSLLTNEELDDMEQCDWIYSSNTDYIVFADIVWQDAVEHIKYIRTKYGGWFSLGWNAGSLDVNNNLTQVLLKDIPYLKHHYIK